MASTPRCNRPLRALLGALAAVLAPLAALPAATVHADPPGSAPAPTPSLTVLEGALDWKDLAPQWAKEVKTDLDELQSVHFRWSTAAPGAVKGRWEILDGANAVLKTGMLASAPAKGAWHMFHVSFAGVSLAAQPRVRVVPLGADAATAVGSPSNAVPVVKLGLKPGAAGGAAAGVASSTRLEGSLPGDIPAWSDELKVSQAAALQFRWTTPFPGVVNARVEVLDASNQVVKTTLVPANQLAGGWYLFKQHFDDALLALGPSVRLVPLKANDVPLAASNKVRILKVAMYAGTPPPGASAPPARPVTLLEGSQDYGDVSKSVWEKKLILPGYDQKIWFHWKTAAPNVVKGRWEIRDSKNVLVKSGIALPPPQGQWVPFKVSFKGFPTDTDLTVYVVPLGPDDLPVPGATSNSIVVRLEGPK